jgi:hypothetical protein
MSVMSLGIKGSKDKGDIIIKWLEDLGGINTNDLVGNNEGCVYGIWPDTKCIVSEFDNAEALELYDKIYTIDDFLAEYPFKIGDTMSFYNCVEEIVGVRWDPILGDMIYTAKSGAERPLNPNDKIINKIDFTDGHYDNEVELILGKDQEAIVENGKVKIIKKLYPYTFRECCDIMGVHVSGELLYDSDEDLTPYENALVDGLDALRKLIICRDAYWKSSGMTQADLPVLYTICWDSLTDKMIKKTCRETLNKLLAFPKEDMRDTFARKFEDLIIKCKNFI